MLLQGWRGRDVGDFGTFAATLVGRARPSGSTRVSSLYPHLCPSDSAVGCSSLISLTVVGRVLAMNLVSYNGARGIYMYLSVNDGVAGYDYGES